MKKTFKSPWGKIIIGIILIMMLPGFDDESTVLVVGLVGLALIVWGIVSLIRSLGARIKRSHQPPAPEPVQVQSKASPSDKDPEKISYPFTSFKPSNALAVKDYIIFDTETTGFSPRDDKIIELAAIKIKNGEISRFHSLINPQRRIPAKSREVHGITDADVAGAPFFWSILPELDAFLEPGLPIVGHNVLFDLRILWWAYHDASKDLGPRIYLDTYKLAQRCFPGRSSYALASLIQDYQLIPGEQEHRSESDVEATWALFKLCCETLTSKPKK